MLVGSGRLGDFLGDPFAFVERTIAGLNSSSQVRFYFSDRGMPAGATLFGYANGSLLTRNLVYGSSHGYSGSDNHFYTPAIPAGFDDGIYDPLFGFSFPQYEVAMSFNAFDKITVRRIAWGANQPRVLEAVHEVKVDSVSVLPEGTFIVYDDVDLGRVFYGKIAESDLQYKSGEAVLYRCADAWRTFAKEPARRDFTDESLPAGEDYTPGICSLRFDKGDSVNDLIRKVTKFIKEDTIPNGVDAHVTQMPDSVLLVKALDKVGMSVAQWLDDALEQTDGGICYIDPSTRSLKVRNYYQEADVTLTQGSYTVVTPSATNPLIVEGNIKRSLNNKFQKIEVVGVGKFTRRIDVGISATYVGAPVENPSGIWTQTLRFFFPHKNVLGLFYDPNDEPQSEIHIDFEYTVNGGSPTGLFNIAADEDVKRMTDPMDANFGMCYWELALIVNSVSSPAIVLANIKLRYTSYDGPLLARITAADPRLRGEGTYMVQRPDLLKFDSAGYTGPGPDFDVLEVPKMLDPTAELEADADRLEKRYGIQPDTAGRIAVHIKALTASILIGTRITNFAARVQNIEIDVINRNLLLDFSDVPIKREVTEQKDAAVTRVQTNRQLNINTRFGISDVAPVPIQAFNKRAQRWPPHDPCDCECPCPT